MGTEFTIRLPAVASIAHPSQQTSDEEESSTTPQRRILIVDDNRDAANLMARTLQLMGHETHTAYDGLEGVQAAESLRPDVTLLDIGLPKMNGYEVARHIRKREWGKDMRLIALSGWGQDEDKRRAAEAGFNHHLTKPVDIDTLQSVLASTTR
jgi:CheY-like chemotaxis protein